VQGNLIGPKRDGIKALPNSSNGVAISSKASGVSILDNSIYSNGGLGIDLGRDGSAPNDPGDEDTGANRLQNKPVLTSAKRRRSKAT
jgi:hypothetical protein